MVGHTAVGYVFIEWRYGIQKMLSNPKDHSELDINESTYSGALSEHIVSHSWHSAIPRNAVASHMLVGYWLNGPVKSLIEKEIGEAIERNHSRWRLYQKAMEEKQRFGGRCRVNKPQFKLKAFDEKYLKVTRKGYVAREPRQSRDVTVLTMLGGGEAEEEIPHPR